MTGLRPNCLLFTLAALFMGGFGMCPAADPPAEPSKLSTIQVPEGYTVELAAGSPLVERPMLAAFDDRGRLYVCDSSGVNLRGPELSKNPPHAIRMLEDTDGDGRFDKSTVFADKLVFPQGVVWHAGSVYCSSPPSFWRLTDTDGDNIADKREELSTGYANTGVADDMHGGSLGPDGRLYWCAGRFPHQIRRPGGEVIHRGTAPLILRCRADGSDLEVVCGSQGNAVGVAFTNEGDMFASGTFLAPNSMGAGLRDALIHCVDGGEYPVRDRNPNEHKKTGDLLPPLTHLGVSASSDLMIARSAAWPGDVRGNLFSALFNMHKIVRHKIVRAGGTFTCRNEDFLVSSHADFHPTDVFEDADGSMLVVDTGGWFRIGCPTSQIAKPDVLGGIYRVRRTAAPRVDDPRGLTIAWDKLPTQEMAARLSDTRVAVRDRAMAELAKRGKDVVPAVSAMLAASVSKEARCAVVWTLVRIDDEAARAAIRAALNDSDVSVRQAAARAAGLNRDVEALSRLIEIVKSDEPSVRREAATALGRLGKPAAVPALLEAMAHAAGRDAANDRFVDHAVIFALIRLNDHPATLAGLKHANPAVKRGALVALDQMDAGGLTPDVVTPHLSASDAVLQQAALWVIAHHRDWGREMVDFFGQWLARQDATGTRREELAGQLLAFAGDSSVQQLIGTRLGDASTPVDTRLLLLEVIAQAAPAKLPAAWAYPLKHALADADERIVRQAVATLRMLPVDKRPLVSRVDAQVDIPETLKNFAGTRLSENFCVRWQGLIRCQTEGTYTFYTESDDGSQLFIDGARVVDNGGSHALRERSGRIPLAAGDHELRLEFVQGGGEAACKLSWSFEGTSKEGSSKEKHGKEIIPAPSLWHRASGKPADAPPLPGLVAEFFELGGRVETFPDATASQFDGLLHELALNSARPMDVRVQSAAAVTAKLDTIEPPLFKFLLTSVAEEQPALVRLDAAEALAKARLDDAQLKQLCDCIAVGGVLEVPKLVRAFENSSDPAVGTALVAALDRSPGLKSLHADTLRAVFEAYPENVRQQAAPLVARLGVDRQKQQSRLVELEGVLTGGDIQRGRELFFANKKAICATCHAVQGNGGKIGPDLGKIGAIRTPRDLLEAIVFPSASFARGYEPYTLVTDSGQVHNGVIGRETAEAIYIVPTTRVETRVPRGAIESLVQGTVSIMPEGMDAQLSREELADLIAFLQSLK